MQNIKNKKIIILSHIITSVPAEDLKKFFLRGKVDQLLFIGHPLFFKAGRPGSYFHLYKQGDLKKNTQHCNRKFPVIVQYIKDFFLSLYWIIKTSEKWDLMVCLDNLNTISGLILRWVGLVKEVVYYTIDFTPQRFNNKILNNFYHYLDKICVKNADLTWNISPRIAEGREKVRGLNRNIYNRQITVPIGIWLDEIRVKPFNEIEQHILVYAGGLSEHQGIQLVLDAIPTIAANVEDFKFKIIGLGDYETELRKKIKELKIEKYVVFLGYFEKHNDVMKKLSECSLAVAMYNEELAKWSYYADPSKIKSYLAVGLPVITTSLTHIAQELVNNNCGLVVKYNQNALAAAIIELLNNPMRYRQFRDNAVKFAKQFDWKIIFEQGLKQIV